MIESAARFRKWKVNKLQNPSLRGGLNEFDLPNETQVAELLDDIASTWSFVRAPEQVGDCFTRPSILRRLAVFLSARISSRADRIVAYGQGCVPLATATSLESGLPFCVIERSEELAYTFGSAHPGEWVALLTTVSGDEAVIANALTAGRLRVESWQSVLNLGPAGNSVARPLFKLADGRLQFTEPAEKG